MKRNTEALEEIVRLLNMGETSEALYELRRLHGLVNRFVCTKCGHAFDGVTWWKCADCGGDVEVKVVVDSKEPAAMEPVDLEAIRKEILGIAAQVERLAKRLEEQR